jgi:AcrR family transcriptional regulator
MLAMSEADAEAGPGRRIGKPGSPTWGAMLDAAENILQAEGYAELTSRRVAERVGVKQRLVYYYFHRMDDLIVATFRRLASREIERLKLAAASDRPLHEIWKVCIDTEDSRLVSEFIALANRVPDLRAEVIAFVEDSRRIQTSALQAAVSRSPQGPAMPPSGLAFAATSMALALGREAQLGVRTGHADAREAIEDLLRTLEPD